MKVHVGIMVGGVRDGRDGSVEVEVEEGVVAVALVLVRGWEAASCGALAGWEELDTAVGAILRKSIACSQTTEGVSAAEESQDKRAEMSAWSLGAEMGVKKDV